MQAKVIISGQGISIKENARRLGRCSGCEALGKDGNCLKLGVSYRAVSDKDCSRVTKTID